MKKLDQAALEAVSGGGGHPSGPKSPPPPPPPAPAPAPAGHGKGS